MCTLTFIPQSSGAIITHSRDEDPKRPSSKEILQKRVDNGLLHFPQDLKAQGTWMGTWVSQDAKTTRTACILNGGSLPYKREPSYPQSRGLLIPALMEVANVKELYQKHSFSAYEPFTLIVWEKQHLYKLVHNLGNTFLVEEDAGQSHIWSSTKLYSFETREQRTENFNTWLKSQMEVNPQSIREFHLFGSSEANFPGFRLETENVIETVSLTQVVDTMEATQMHYHNLKHSEVQEVLT